MNLHMENQVKKNQFSRPIIKKDNEFIRQSLKGIQYMIIIIYIIILYVILLMGIHKGVYLYLSEDDYAVHNLGYEKNLNDNSLYEIFLGFTRAVLTFHIFMPFNWFGLIQISYYILSCFVKWDGNIKRNKNETVEIINSESLANFGQVRHILTDKTGTLTKRKFEVKLCSIKGRLFSFQFNDIENDIFVGVDINELEIIKVEKSKSKFSFYIKEFIESLSVCHSVKPINSPDVNNSKSHEDNDNPNKSFKKIKSSNSMFDNNTMKTVETEFVSAFYEEVAIFKILKKIWISTG